MLYIFFLSQDKILLLSVNKNVTVHKYYYREVVTQIWLCLSLNIKTYASWQSLTLLRFNRTIHTEVKNVSQTV